MVLNKNFPVDIPEDIRDCRNITDLAKLLNINLKALFFFAYKKERLYLSFNIKKKNGGARNISAPIEALKNTTKKINSYLSVVYEEYKPKSVHGFVYDRDVVTNAGNHLDRKYILNIDLLNFFETITAQRIYGLFKRYPFIFGNKFASILTGIVTYNNCLPQGSPCSPVLSNMVCLKMDKQLINLANENGWRYTRYADDITFSANKISSNLANFASDGINVGEKIVNIINKNGFAINEKKTRLSSHNQSKWVTGIKVNKKCNVSRKYVRNVRAMLHVWEAYDEKLAEKTYNAKYNFGKNKKFRSVVNGKIEHIGHVKTKKDLIYIKLHNRYCELVGESHKRLPETKKDEYLNKVLMIQGQSGYGSGFFITQHLILTCAHVVKGSKKVKFTTRLNKLPVEFKEASVIDINIEKDYAILFSEKKFNEFVFKCNLNKGLNMYSHNDAYISVGYAGFRTDGNFWVEPSIADQKIVQTNQRKNVNSFDVSGAMWKGMSGGPIILEHTDYVEGYIVNGASSLDTSEDVKSHSFYPISNIPKKYYEPKFLTLLIDEMYGSRFTETKEVGMPDQFFT